jgi:SacI homology domain
LHVDAAADQFVMPMILGFVRQMVDVRVSAGAKSEWLTVSLLARRSRFRAGTRHWRRGIDGQGNVANFVESEQARSAVCVLANLFLASGFCHWSMATGSAWRPCGCAAHLLL